MPARLLPTSWRVVGVLLVFLASGALLADVLHLSGGGRLVVADWWEKDGKLYYETDAGVIGIDRSEIVHIEAREGARTPAMRARGAAPVATSVSAPREEKNGTPVATQPTLEQVEERIERFETALRREGRESSRRRIEEALADLHVLRARHKRSRGDEDGAAYDYERAVELEPLHRLARIELAWLELSRDDVDRAALLAETGLSAEPDDPHLLEVRGEVLYRRNRLLDARDAFRRALTNHPKAARIEERLAKLSREFEAERDFRRADSSHFSLRYDGERDDRLGRSLLDALELAYGDLTRELDAYPREPVTVIVYTRREFSETTRLGPEVAGLFDGKIRLPVGGLDTVDASARRVLRHELVHALLHVRGRGRVPRWLHEGLAQLLEPRDPASIARAMELAASRGTPIALEPFSYPSALSFTAFLDERYSRSRILWLVAELAEGRSEDDAFQ